MCVFIYINHTTDIRHLPIYYEFTLEHKTSPPNQGFNIKNAKNSKHLAE